MQSFKDGEDQCEQTMEKGIVKHEEEWTKTPMRSRHPADVSAHLQESMLLWLSLDFLSSSQGCLLRHPLRGLKGERLDKPLSYYAKGQDK